MNIQDAIRNAGEGGIENHLKSLLLKDSYVSKTGCRLWTNGSRDCSICSGYSKKQSYLRKKHA